MTLASRLAPHLPYLRRYARALTGSQSTGDGLVAATLEAIVADHALLGAGAPRLALFKSFQSVWLAATKPAASNNADPAEQHAAEMASKRLAAITPRPRQALLLGAMEGFSETDIAELISCDPADVPALIADALAEIATQTVSRVLIIEDEPIIAMDIEMIVTGLGHGVIGIATTQTEAAALFDGEAPGLVLADIQLRDGSSGIDAVRHILAHQSVPVIFITGFPERLLTGERPEPTFLITKPFQASQVQAAIAQALFFNSTAPL